MQLSHAFVALLTVAATQISAAPLRNVAGPSSSGPSALIARSDSIPLARAVDLLAARGLAPDAAEASRAIFARYASVTNPSERDVAIANEMHRRGILDMLVAALRDLITELLGSSGMARKRDADKSASTNQALGQLTGLDFSTTANARASWSKMLDALSQALEQESKSLASKSSSKSAAGKASNSTSASAAAATATAPSASGNVTADAAAGASVSNSTQIAEHLAAVHQGNKDKRELLSLIERQEGVEGVLQVLRSLVDAILNTLLPMSSRSENSTASTKQAYGKHCPPEGTPNDGMYRPGCPGYGRREVNDDVVLVARQTGASASASAQLESMLPLLEELIQKLPQIMAGASGNLTAGSTKANVTTKASTKKPLSAAKVTFDARSLLEADGFELEKRQATDGGQSGGISISILNDILNGLLGNLLGGNDSSDASSATPAAGASGASKAKAAAGVDGSSSGGVNVTVLNDALNGLLGNLLGGSGSSAAKRDVNINALNDVLNGALGNLLGGANSNVQRRDGINISALNNVLNGLLGNLLGGSNSKVSKRDGVNISALNGVLNGLLGNLLGGSGSTVSRRALLSIAANQVLQARADFKPVWEEVKKLGNSHFKVERRDATAGLAPVWSSFRDMVDGAYAHGIDRRSPSPKADTSAFTHEAAKYIKQTFFSSKAHQQRRELSQSLHPLANAAGSFAKQQMKEWTSALNDYNEKNGKTHH